jgi:hypothetical protein
MFSIRVFTPPIPNQEGWSEAGAELRVGGERFGFLVDLRHWHIADYERQWRQATKHLLHGAPSAALMTAYRGAGAVTHLMWGLWRDSDCVYIQQHSVLGGDLDTPFDPDAPYPHLGERIATSTHGLPIPEWRVDLLAVYAAAMGLRWPLA